MGDGGAGGRGSRPRCRPHRGARAGRRVGGARGGGAPSYPLRAHPYHRAAASL